MNSDVIDQAAGLAPGMPLHTARRFRECSFTIPAAPAIAS